MPTFTQKSSSLPSTTSSPVDPVRLVVGVLVFGLGVVLRLPRRCLRRRRCGLRGSSSSPFGQFARRPCPTARCRPRGGDDLVDRAEHVVPAAPDDLGDRIPAFEPGLAGEVVDPALTVPRLGLPLKNFDTAGSSHTDPMDDTIVSAPASAATDSSVGFSATSSSTATRSNCLSSAGSNLCALASVSSFHAGWSARSLSVLVRTNATRSATVSRRCRGHRPCPETPPTRRRRRASGVPTRCSGHRRTGSGGLAQGQQPCGTQ